MVSGPEDGTTCHNLLNPHLIPIAQLPCLRLHESFLATWRAARPVRQWVTHLLPLLKRRLIIRAMSQTKTSRRVGARCQVIRSRTTNPFAGVCLSTQSRREGQTKSGTLCKVEFHNPIL